MRIIGYCALGAVALALFIAMCAILHNAVITQRLATKAQADNGVHAAEPAAATASPAKP